MWQPNPTKLCFPRQQHVQRYPYPCPQLNDTRSLSCKQEFYFIYVHEHSKLWYYFYNQVDYINMKFKHNTFRQNIHLKFKHNTFRQNIHSPLCKYQPLQIKVRFTYLQTRVEVGLFVPLVVPLFDSILCNMCS